MKPENYLRNDWFDYHVFYDYVATLGFNTLVEVGMWKGHSISHLADKVRDTNAKLYAVDLWELTNDKYLKGFTEVPIIYQIYNKNLELSNTRHLITDIKMESSEAATQFTETSVCFVFIDASHDYDSVKRDILAWRSKIRAGGMLAGHDYGPNWPGVIRAVDEIFGDLVIRPESGTVWYTTIKDSRN